jgi:hypothetical protein
MTAPMVLDGAMHRAAFLSYMEQVLVPTLKPGEIVVMDNLPRCSPTSSPGAAVALACRRSMSCAPAPGSSSADLSISSSALRNKVGAEIGRNAQAPRTVQMTGNAALIQSEPDALDREAEVSAIPSWLAEHGGARIEPEALISELCARLLLVGVPLSRVSFGVPTLHPQGLRLPSDLAARHAVGDQDPA